MNPLSPLLRSGPAALACCALLSAANGAPAAPQELAELAGCYAGERSAWVRAQISAGSPPLLVVDDESVGPLRYDPAVCRRLPWRDLPVAELRLLRAEAARTVYGPAASNGVVIVELDVVAR